MLSAIEISLDRRLKDFIIFLGKNLVAFLNLIKVAGVDSCLLINDFSFRVIVVGMEMQDLGWVIESVREITILIVADGVDGVLGCFGAMSLLLCLLLL